MGHGRNDRPAFRVEKVAASDSSITRTAGAPAFRSGQPIRIPKTAEVVAADIRKMIIRGEMREGDFLQPEAQLMDYYGTSRPTIREAFRILENEQFISVTRGSRSGARVYSPTVEGVARYAGFALQVQGVLLSDIYQARLAVEPFAARLAARAPDPAAVDRLRTELETLSQLIKDPKRIAEFRGGVARLHLAIVDLANSPTLTMMAAMLARVIESHQSKFVSRSPDTEAISAEEAAKRNRAALKSFEKVIDLIEAKDADGAESQLRRHLENADPNWLSGYDQTSVIDVLE
jgi:DNA-binding FadR family transcriptional regulator